MKTAKRVLAIVMAMLMVVGSVALAASAEGNIPLQQKIDNAGVGEVVTIEANSWGQSVVIDKDVVLDLQGFKLNGKNGETAITVTDGADVTVMNGYVISRFAQYADNAEGILGMLDTVIEGSPEAIKVTEGSNITLRNVRVCGSNTRIPSTDESIATGTALVLKDGSTATLENVSMNGLYCVDNKDGGEITLKDAFLIGWAEVFTDTENAPAADEGYSKVNAAELLETSDFLKPGVSFTADEMNFAKYVLESKVVFVTKDPGTALITIDEPRNVATIHADAVNCKAANSDCSYTLVPLNAYIIEGGVKKYFALDTDLPIAAVKDKFADIKVQYCVTYDLQEDVYAHVNGGYNDIALVYNMIADALDFNWAFTAYDEIINKLADVYVEIEDLGNRNIEGVDVIPQFVSWATYNDLKRDLIAIGGVTMYNAAMAKVREEYDYSEEDLPDFNEWSTLADWDEAQLYYGADIPEYEADDEGYVTRIGILDVINDIVNELKNAAGYSVSFKFDGENWGNVAQVLMNHYQDVLDLIPEALDAVNALADDFDPDLNPEIGQVADGLDFGDFDLFGYLDTFKQYAADAEYTINAVMEDPSFQYVKSFLDGNSEQIAELFNKAGRVLTHPENYVDLYEYLDLTNKQLKSFYVEGDCEQRIIPKTIGLHVMLKGVSGATLSFGDAIADMTLSENVWTDVTFDGDLTITVAPNSDNVDFLYWQNAETTRIMTTNPTITLATNVDRYLYIKFAPKSEMKLIAAGTAGAVVVEAAMNGNSYTFGAADAPSTPGFAGSGWGPDGVAAGGTINVGGLSASGYKTGNSAFDELGVIYGGDGSSFLLSTNTTNKYLVTPKYGNAEKHAIFFKDSADGKKRGNAAVQYGYVLTYTAKGGNFSYWKDSVSGEAVSVLKTYKQPSIVDRTVEAVYNAGAKSSCVSIIRKDEANPYTFYVERSVADSDSVLSHGVIYALNSPENDVQFTKADLKVENTTLDGPIMKFVSTTTTNTGIYTVTPSGDFLAGDSIIAVGFVELANGGMIYSEPATVTVS